jgi:hypothetical protein
VSRLRQNKLILEAVTFAHPIRAAQKHIEYLKAVAYRCSFKIFFIALSFQGPSVAVWDAVFWITLMQKKKKASGISSLNKKT